MESKVLEFHKTFNCSIADAPGFPYQEIRNCRIDLLKEEFDEYLHAERSDNLVEVADGLADMVYVIFGTAIAYGIPLEKILDEVHASNMSKLGEDGRPIFREDGKVLKGPNFFRPNIPGILYANGA